MAEARGLAFRVDGGNVSVFALKGLLPLSLFAGAVSLSRRLGDREARSPAGHGRIDRLETCRRCAVHGSEWLSQSEAGSWIEETGESLGRTVPKDEVPNKVTTRGG